MTMPFRRRGPAVFYPVCEVIMARLLDLFVRGIARIHDTILRLNDSGSQILTDKQLHFIVMGLAGMALFLVIYPLFILLSRNHVLVIAWIYVFTVLVMLSFAIEIGQGLSGTGNMEMRDVISGLAGFMFLFIIFAAVRGVFLLLWRLIAGDSRKD